MKTRFLFRGAFAAAFVLGLSELATAQGQTNPPITIPVEGPSGMDVLRYGASTFDRTIAGSRAKSMGGASLAMDADVNVATVNPAGFSRLTGPTLSADTRWLSGGVTATDAPSGFPSPLGTEFPIENYAPTLTSNYAYNDIAFGLPIIFLGRRAGLGVAYRRLIDFRSGTEERFLVMSPFGDADFGSGEQFSGSVDALSPSLSMAISSRLSLGATINFMTGSVASKGDQGVTTFGQVVTEGFVTLDQEVNGTSVDLGARLELIPNFTVAGVLQAGHDLKFTSGKDQFRGLTDPTEMDPTPIIFNRTLLDHSLSVPTMFGLGLAWKTMSDRVIVAGDYWNRAWGNATFSRESFATFTIFPDTLNLAQTFSTVIPTGGSVTKGAGLKDTHHIRIGAEWLVKGDGVEGITIPVRAGFRNEPRTFPNVRTDRMLEINRQIGVIAAEGSRPVADRQADIRGLMDEVFQDGSLLLAGDEIPTTTISIGTGIHVDSFSFDVGIARTQYEYTHLFLGSFNEFTLSTYVQSVTEDRSLTEMSFTATLRF
ncbi:MAG: hypothetical protein SGI90_09750 [Candidatus Eisenbacteria bacterium]|nr:hypothetical protein [Candidatus Eisenbacteria bacterium]